MAAKKTAKNKKSNKKVKKPIKKAKTPKKKDKAKKQVNTLVLPKKLAVKSPELMVVYGMQIEPKKVSYAAVEAYNKKKYNAEDIKLQDYCVTNPKFHNLMVKIAVLDRIHEEIKRLYPEANIKRLNSIQLLVEK
jgi:uncharacterized ubiquitin-like protein YukD